MREKYFKSILVEGWVCTIKSSLWEGLVLHMKECNQSISGGETTNEAGFVLDLRDQYYNSIILVVSTTYELGFRDRYHKSRYLHR